MKIESFLSGRGRYLTLFFCVLFVLGTAPAEAGWRELLPVYGGPVNRIVTDAGGTLYIATPGGLFRSMDAGATWAPANGDLPSPGGAPIATDPVSAGVVYTRTAQGLYRTGDGGTTWQRLPLNLPGGTYVAEIAIAPSDPSHVYVATWGAYVYRSLDGGATWEQRSSGLYGGWGGPAFIVAIAVDPTDADRVYTSTWRGQLFRSDDAATTWYPIGGGGTWANRQVYVSPSDPHVLYTTNDEYWFGRGTVLRSADWGASWSNVGRPTGAASDAYQLAIDPTDPDVVYVTTSQGIYKSTTGGGSWSRVFAPSGPRSMESVAVAAGAPARVFAGSYYSGFYRSLDAGATWSQENAGLAAAAFTGLEICRDVPSTMYAGVASQGYYRTADGGATWVPIEGFEGHSYGGLGVHPEDPDVLITSTSDGTTSRVWRTADGGATFTATASGYGSRWFRFNPHDPSRAHTSISDWQGGFLYSGTGGASWSVPYWWYIYPRDYDFHPVFPDVVFSLGNRYTGAPLSTLHVIWSNTGGLSWTGPAFGQGSFEDLALDQNDPETLYVAGRIASEGTQGIYKFAVTYSGSDVVAVARVPGTFNSGLTDPAVSRLVYDAANARLYATTASGIFRSRDQGASWSLISSDLPYIPTSAMAVTPDGSRLIVGTTGGIWEYVENQPPVARCADAEAAAGPSCAADASVDGGSYDPDDDDITLDQDPPGPYPLGETLVTLTVTDVHGASDTCTARVAVVDETPPAVRCNAPETIIPPDAPISFTATAADNCGLGSMAITGYDCWAINGAGRRIDKKGSCEVTIEDDTITVVDSGGVGDHIEWTVEAADGGGNVATVACGPVEVVNPGGGKK